MERKVIVAGVVLVLCTAYAMSATYTWGGGGLDDFWSTPDNWAGNEAPVDGAHTVLIPYVENASSILMDRDQTINQFHMGRSGDTGTTTFTVNSGSHLSLLNAGNGFSHIGQQDSNNTGTAVLNVEGAFTARFLGIGSFANGTVNVDGGTLNIARASGITQGTLLNIGEGAAHGDGILNVLNGGTVNFNRVTEQDNAVELRIGFRAMASTKDRQVNISGGTLNMNNGGTANGAILSVGHGNNANNTELNLSGDGVINMTTDVVGGRELLSVGHGSNSSGVFNQTGGTLNISNGGGGFAFMSIGHGADSTGTYNFSAGQANSIGINVGTGGTGYMNLSGTAELNVSTVRVGEAAGSQGIINMTGGTLVSSSYFSLGFASTALSEFNISGGAVDIGTSLVVGRAGAGKLTITGDAATVKANALYVGDAAGGAGTVEFLVGGNGVTVIEARSGVFLDAGEDSSVANLMVSLLGAPPAGRILLVDNQGTDSVSGVFDSLNGGSATEGASVVLSYGGIDYAYTLTYQGIAGTDGIANDIMLIPEPATLAILGLGMCVVLKRKR